MKTLLKRLFSTVAVLTTLVGGSIAHAAGTPSFNSIDGDQEFLTGRNVTQNGSFTDPVTGVQNNDVIDVAVYYHNASEDVDGNVAKNVRIKVNVPTSLDTTHVLTGELSADNLATVSGTKVNGVEVGKENLTIQSDAATTLAFVPGSVRWYPNRSNTTGAGANLPNGQNGDSIVTNGITIGDLRGCFQYSGFVMFSVKVTGPTVTPKKAILSLKKEVRRAGTNDTFVTKNSATPGDLVEYRVTITNVDGAGVAKNVSLKDVLPAGVTYVGPTRLIRNGVTTTLQDGITTAQGIQVISSLNPLEQVYVTFIAATSNSFKNDECAINSVTVGAENADLPGAQTASTCFSVKPPATPTPTPVPTKNPPVKVPTPTPELPKTGPTDDLIPLVGMSGALGTVGRYLYLKQQVRKQARDISVL